MGNTIKDSVGIGGPRVATGGNALGLAGQGSAPNASGVAKGGVRGAGKGGAGNPLGL